MANSAFDHSPTIVVPGSSTNTALVRWSGTGADTFLDSTILVGATTMGLAADTDLLTFSNGTLTIAGTLAATTLTGAGSGITGLNASNLGSGTIPDARFPATLPAISGANLTNLPASGATLSGSTDNTVVTVTGSNAMIGETGLTFNAGVLTVDSGATNVSAIVSIEVNASATSDPMLRWREGSGNGDANNQQYEAWMDVENGQFRFRSQNIDGSSSEGDIWVIDDGTNDVRFNGDVTLSAVGAGLTSQIITLYTPSNGGAPEIFFKEGDGSGSANNMKYRLAYNGTSSNYFSMRSYDTNGSSADDDIWRVYDGTAELRLNNNLGSNFDKYDDALVLERHFSDPYRVGQDLIQESQDELIEMGILVKDADGWIGQSLNRWVPLLAGGVYQTRQRVDDLYEELKAEIKELKAEVDALKG